jgi:hypothetical protein
VWKKVQAQIQMQAAAEAAGQIMVDQLVAQLELP